MGEFELKGQGTRGTIGRPGYIDPFSRLEQTYKDFELILVDDGSDVVPTTATPT